MITKQLTQDNLKDIEQLYFHNMSVKEIAHTIQMPYYRVQLYVRALKLQKKPTAEPGTAGNIILKETI